MDPQFIAAGVGSVLPLLVSVIVRSAWPGWLKGVVVVVSSIVAGVVTAWATGELTGASAGQSVLIVAGAAVTAYKLFWQPTGIGPALERATEPTPRATSG